LVSHSLSEKSVRQLSWQVPPFLVWGGLVMLFLGWKGSCMPLRYEGSVCLDVAAVDGDCGGKLRYSLAVGPNGSLLAAAHGVKFACSSSSWSILVIEVCLRQPPWVGLLAARTVLLGQYCCSSLCGASGGPWMDLCPAASRRLWCVRWRCLLYEVQDAGTAVAVGTAAAQHRIPSHGLIDRSYLLRQSLMAVPACPEPLSRAPALHQQQRTACVGRYCVLLSRAVLCTACLELYCRYTLCAVCADVHCCCCTYPAIATAEAVWVLWRGLGTVVSLEQV
jgi:hypothetical protein